MSTSLKTVFLAAGIAMLSGCAVYPSQGPYYAPGPAYTSYRVYVPAPAPYRGFLPPRPRIPALVGWRAQESGRHLFKIEFESRVIAVDRASAGFISLYIYGGTRIGAHFTVVYQMSATPSI